MIDAKYHFRWIAEEFEHLHPIHLSQDDVPREISLEWIPLNYLVLVVEIFLKDHSDGSNWNYYLLSRLNVLLNLCSLPDASTFRFKLIYGDDDAVTDFGLFVFLVSHVGSRELSPLYRFQDMVCQCWFHIKARGHFELREAFDALDVDHSFD